VTLATREVEEIGALIEEAPPEPDRTLGIALAPLPEVLKDELGIDSGVVIGQVEPGSIAARTGLQEQDIILEVARQAVEEPEDVAQAWQSAQAEDRPLLMRVLRGEMALYVALES
jgi:serine protease Do